jgi:cell division protein FtsB
MYQQINLYQPVFRRQHKIFSAVTLLQILAVIAVLLLALYGHAQWTLGNLQHTATSLEAQFRQLEAKLTALEAASQVSSATDSMNNELNRLRRRIAGRQQLLDRFDRFTLKSGPGFGDIFEALALHTLPGLWLTGVQLTQAGDTELRGTTLDPELVPRYLQQLPDHPRFRSLQQGSVHLARHEPENREVEFILRSKPRPEIR